MITKAKRTSRYETFDILKEATKLKLVEDSKDCLVYHKMLRTGKLEFHDYGTGFLNFEITARMAGEKSQIRLWIATVDDGDLGAWSGEMSRAECRNTVHAIAHDVMDKMAEFPTLKDLNTKLIRFGLKVEHE